MFRAFAPYIVAAALAVGAFGYVQYLRMSLDRATTQRDQLGADLNLCMAQIDNLQEDISSDNQVDAIDDLSEFGAQWLRDNPGVTSTP